MGNISFWQLLVIAAIIAILFGTKKLRNIGSDIGASIKGFKKEINDIYDDDNIINKEKDKKNNFKYKKVNDKEKNQ